MWQLYFLIIFPLLTFSQKVFSVDYSSQASGNEGNWFFVDYSSQADVKVFFVDYSSQADVKIYFVDYSSQSGWRDKSKKHLFY